LDGYYSQVKVSADVAANTTCAPCALEMQATSVANSTATAGTPAPTNAAIGKRGVQKGKLVNAVAVLVVGMLVL